MMVNIDLELDEDLNFMRLKNKIIELENKVNKLIQIQDELEFNKLNE